MTRKQALALVVSLTLLGFILRIYRIDAVPFRGDEAFTVLNWVSHPLIDTLRSEIPLKDPQPPLAIAVFRVWALWLGTGEFNMRILPAMLNLLGIPAMYAIGQRLGDRKVGVLAALLWTVHPLLIWHAQDARAYAIWAAASTVALSMALRALDRKRRIDWLLYIAAATLAAYLYYLELFALLALNLYVVARYRTHRPTIRRWLVSQVAVALLLAPWFLQPRLLYGSGYSGTTFPFEPAQIVTWLIPALNFGDRTLLPTTLESLGPVVTIILLLAVWVQWRANRWNAILLGLTGFLPVILLSVISLKMNIFTPRYVLSVVPAYILLLSLLIVTMARVLKGPLLRYGLPLALAGGWLFVGGLSLYNYYAVPDPIFAKAPDWRGLMTYLRARISPEDLVVQAAADEAFTLYFDGLSDFQRLPANPRQSDTEITNGLKADMEKYRSIWLVARTPDDWPNASTPGDWLESNMQRVRQTQVGTLPAAQFMPWQVSSDEIEDTPLASFGDVTEMVDIQTSFEPGNQLLVRVYWRPISQTDSPLKVFVHLIGPTNPATGTPLWSQDDHFPQKGRISTTSWSIGETYRDIYQLSLADVPTGDDSLEIGLYDPDTGIRLPLAGGDSYLISTITLPSG